LLQMNETLFYAGLVVIIVGILLVIAGVASAFSGNGQGERAHTESKGIILIGPIPIVWGMGKKAWVAALIVGILITAILLLAWS